ncbi:MAG: hypothetical protein ACD_54C00108G0007, partial [uncultured bacterium]
SIERTIRKDRAGLSRGGVKPPSAARHADQSKNGVIFERNLQPHEIS